jgi:hypothetical protein
MRPRTGGLGGKQENRKRRASKDGQGRDAPGLSIHEHAVTKKDERELRHKSQARSMLEPRVRRWRRPPGTAV